MEYALDGYGYSIARVVRSVLAQQRGENGKSLGDSLDKYLMDFFSNDFWEAGEDLAARMLGEIFRDHPFKLERPPELLATLRSLEGRRPVDDLMLRVGSAAKAAFDTIQQVHPLRITQCSIERNQRGREYMMLGMYSRSLKDSVRVDDLVCAGVIVALRAEQDGVGCQLSVLPRIYRKICQNGLIIFEANGSAHSIDEDLLRESGEVAPLIPILEDTIRTCFDTMQFDQAVDGFRQNAKESLDLDTAIAEVNRLHLGPIAEQAVLSRYAMDGDSTRWGLLNAMTAEARTAPSALMLRLEQSAGELAWESIRKPSLQRSKKLSVA